MPDLDTRSAGNGLKRTAMWLDGEPIVLAGVEEWLEVGDRHENDWPQLQGKVK